MKKIYIIILITASTIASAQNLEWARNMGGTGVDFSQAIAVDNAGNVYSTGLFANTADFDPGPGVFNLTSAGSWDIYISKFDSAGIFQWAKRIGSTGDDRGLSIATDGIGVYITGMFSLLADFDPGAGVFNMTNSSAGSYDAFVLKLDTSGNFVWAKRFGGTSNDRGNSLALDASSNVHITGYFTGNANGITNLNSSGQTDIFIMKLSTAGNLVWAKKMGSTGLDEGNGITVSSSGNVYSTGTFQVTVNFNPGGNFNLSAVGGSHWDIYIHKLDAGGNFIWARGIGGLWNGSAVEDRGFAITTDAAENIYTTGYFAGTADFNTGPGVFNLSSNSGGKDAYILKMSGAGNFIWAKNVGGWLYDQGSAISVDLAGNVYTAGFFKSTGDFDPGPGVYNLTANGGDDIFLLKLDALGNFVWAIDFGIGNNNQGQSALTSVGGIVYASGFFWFTVDFDPGPGIYNLTSAGGTDAFVLKLNDIQTPLPIELLSFTAVAVNNNKVKLNWVTATEINNDYFTVERSVDAYNWEKVIQVNGNGNSNTIIEYNAWDYSPYKGTSYYRLKQTDFDGQFSYSNIDVVNLTAQNEIIISPIPANSFITISNLTATIESIKIYDASGRLCISVASQLGSLPVVIDISDLVQGIYFVEINNSRIKIVKE